MVYKHLEMINQVRVEEKRCRRNKWGKNLQFLIDKMVLNNCKKKQSILIIEKEIAN